MMAAARSNGFRITRIQTNYIARRERQLLDWFCDHLPNAVTPDHLTTIGILGAVLAFASDLASRYDPGFLWLASLGLVLHWFGDSLDGSLARRRGTERPVYGYFLDHTVDAFCNLLIMAGLGFTSEVRMDVALFALVGYYLLCIYVFISNHVSGMFRLSFLGFGPTELRLCLIAIGTIMFFAGHRVIDMLGHFVSIYDAIIFGAGLVFTAIFVTQVVLGVRELRGTAAGGAAVGAATSRGRRPTVGQILAMNASSRSK